MTIRVLLSAVFLIAGSQSYATSLAECRSVESALERLDCYDALPLEEGGQDTANEVESEVPKSSDAEDSSFSNWERREERDPISDRKNVSFFAEPNEPQRNTFGGSKTVFLQLRCFDNTTAVVLFFDEFQIQDRVKIVVRLDDDEPFDVSWTVSSNNKAAGLWSGKSAIPFIRQLANRDLITMRVFLEDGADTYQFESRRINEYANEIANACNWEFPTK